MKEDSAVNSPPSQGLYDPQNEHDSCGVGFVVDLKGRKSWNIVQSGIEVLLNLQHRGACGAEKNTGDGAGILMQVPHKFLAAACGDIGIELPAAGQYGVGVVFLPNDPGSRAACEHLFEEVVADEGQKFLGWREVPTDNSMIGPTARRSQPVIKQLFIGRGPSIADDDAFERKLYVIRRRARHEVRRLDIPEKAHFYIPSLSARTIVYKGMLNPDQLTAFFPDLLDKRVESALAMVHSRFSTNTFPSWQRAHPYRMIAHNGEINTLRGNVNWMHARESMFESKLFGDDLKKCIPVVDTDGSDSGMFDNVLELLFLAGRSLPHAMMMMIPEPWSNHESMSQEKKDFYSFHGCLMEPWDGPASVAFTDGIRIGATLDRNGLRPSRYYVTKDGLVVMASEVGVLDIPPERILRKGRLQPGRMFLVDTSQGRIIDDEEIKREIATAAPYGQWLKENLVSIKDLPQPPSVIEPDHATVLRRQEAFGYTSEDLKVLVGPMAIDGVEPNGSMGTDTPLAVLSRRPQLLYNYFKQLFAQVTNPPVDAIREEIIMAVDTAIGPEGNLLEPTPVSARQIELPTPVLRNAELEKLRALDGGARAHGFKSITLPTLFDIAQGGEGLKAGIEVLRASASKAIADGYNIIILSDRGHDGTRAPIPALLATAAVQHHLLREGSRTRVGLVVESGEPREVHHFALLLGYGASAVNPYLALESLHDMIGQGLLPGDPEKAELKYVKAIGKGIVKVCSKMGISTIQSYHGAQVFEAIGLNQATVDEYFTWTASRVGGIGLEEIAAEIGERHHRAFADRPLPADSLDPGGQYQYRRTGELHLFNPVSIHKLQQACRSDDYGTFKEYSSLIDDQAKSLCTLRGLMELKSSLPPVPIEEVESIETILKRFKTGAMSYGSISKEAHETLAIAMNRIGGKSNTGEGGEDPARYVPDANGDSRRSAIKQVASGRFGVTSYYLVNADEIQIKMAQGAKPGEGGQLPGTKVYPWIAKVRYSTPGVGLISPPPHHDIYSIEDLAQLIHDLKNANPRARISVKLVAEVGRGDDRRGRGQGARRPGAHQRARRRHGRLAAHQHQARRHSLGARAGRDAPGAGAQQPAQPHHRGDGRSAQDRPRRGGGGAARRRGVRFLDGAAGGGGLHHDARLPPQHLPGGRGHPGPEAAGEVLRQPGPRGELHALRGHRSPRADGEARLPHGERDDRSHRVHRDEAGGRALEGAGARLLEDPLPAGRRAGGGALQDRGAGARHREFARYDDAAAALPEGHRQGREGGGVAPHSQRQPGGRHHHRQRGDAQVRPERPAGRHHPAALHRVGGPELRRLRPARDDADPGGRRERLRRQGPVRWADHRLPASGGDLRPRGEHHRRQRRSLRRDQRRGLHPRRGWRAVLRSQQRRQGGRRRRGRPRLRVHDGRPGGHPGRHGAQLRRWHVGRRGLRARRRGSLLRRQVQQGDGGPRRRSTTRRRSSSSTSSSRSTRG